MILSTNKYFVNIPIYGAYTDVYYFPAPATHREGKFSLLTNELKPLYPTGSFVPVPYLPGHDYVVLSGTKDGHAMITYSHGVPDCLQGYSYSTELHHPEVIWFSGKPQ